MEEKRLELKIGILVLAALGGVAALLYLTGEVSLRATSALSVELAHSGNVVQGAPVRLAGISVGRVAAVRLLPDRRDARGEPMPVQVELAIDQDTFRTLSSDLEVMIATQGPLGEPYVELAPGSERAPKLTEGQAVRGQDPVRLEVLFQRMGALLAAFDGGGRAGSDAVSAIASIGRLAARVDDLLAGSTADASALVSELEQTVKDVRLVVARLRQSIEPGGDAAAILHDGAAIAALLKRRAPELTENADATLAALARVTRKLDAEDGERLKATLVRVSNATEALEKLANRGERLLGRIESGEGTLGALQNDPTLYEDLRALVTDLRKHPWKVLWKD